MDRPDAARGTMKIYWKEDGKKKSMNVMIPLDGMTADLAAIYVLSSYFAKQGETYWRKRYYNECAQMEQELENGKTMFQDKILSNLTF